MTPLIIAVKKSDRALTRKLLEAKALPEAKDSAGKSALEYAQAQAALPFLKRPWGAKSILALLQSYPPKKEAKQRE